MSQRYLQDDRYDITMPFVYITPFEFRREGGEGSGGSTCRFFIPLCAGEWSDDVFPETKNILRVFLTEVDLF